MTDYKSDQFRNNFFKYFKSHFDYVIEAGFGICNKYLSAQDTRGGGAPWIIVGGLIVLHQGSI